MTTRSLRLRLLLLGALSVALALIASTIGLLFLFERHVERRVDAELNAYLNQLIAVLDRDADGGSRFFGHPPTRASSARCRVSTGRS